MARTSFTQKLDNLETEPESLEVEKDKTRILNAITGAEFDATPDLKHPAFGLVNCFLRSQIIANGMQQLADAGQMGKAIECVCADSGRTTLALRLDKQEQLRDLEELTPLRNLQALTSLTLSFNGCRQLADVSALGTAVGYLQALTSLYLDFWGCSKLSDKLRTTFDSKAAFLAALEA